MAKNITDKNTLKSWFKRGVKPLESQFHAWMDAYWHKTEKIPTDSIEGLENVLNNKAEANALNEISEALRLHKEDNKRHKTPEEQNKLDNLTDNPDETYATKEELESITPNFFVLNKSELTSSDWEKNEAIKETLKSQLRTFTDLNRPLCVIVNAYDMKYYPEIICLRNLFVDKDNYTIIFKVKWPKEFQYEIGCDQSQFSVGVGNFETITNITNEFLPELHTLFLYDNSNYIIDASDFDPDNQLAKSINWQKWNDLLKAGIMPVVYLRSDLSEHYCLAEYKYFFNEVSQEYDTDVEIAYRKVVDGQLQLWIERRYFKGSIMNGYYDGENFEEHGLKLTKIPLK